MQTPTVSTCPKCAKQVSVPTGIDVAARVRCPWCRANYVLGDAIGWTPPALIVIEGEAAFEPPAEESHEAEEHNEAAAVATGLPKMSAVAALRPRPSKSVLRTLIEVVLGGLAGCLVAYYALALWFGPEFHRVGLPRLPLPFISRLTEPADKTGQKTETPPKDGQPADRSAAQ